MTLEEALEASVQSNAEDNEVIVIDNDLRKITIPARHGRAPRITTSGSRVCMDGKRCTQTNYWQISPSTV